MYLKIVAGLRRRGLGKEAVSGAGAAVVVDGELNARDAPVLSDGHLGPDARQRLRYQRRHTAMEHPVRLPGKSLRPLITFAVSLIGKFSPQQEQRLH